MRNKLYKRDKLGLNQNYLKYKAITISEKLLEEELKNKFHASDGWLEKVFNRNNISGVKLHGEANE